MNKLTRWVSVGGGVAALVLVSSVVRAGNTYFAPVTLSGTATTGTASGTATTARTSADISQFILCQITASATSSTMTCTASDASGNFRQCVSSAAPFIQAVTAMTSFDNISFSWNNGACTQVQITNGSRFLP